MPNFTIELARVLRDTFADTNGRIPTKYLDEFIERYDKQARKDMERFIENRKVKTRLEGWRAAKPLTEDKNEPTS